MKNLEFYPTEVQNEILETLKWFSGCYITECESKFKVSTGCGISDKYSDKETKSNFLKNTDVYSREQIRHFISQM